MPDDDEPVDPQDVAADDEALSDAYDAGLSGDLGTVRDGEWLAAHERLIADLHGIVPRAQLEYTWDPARPPETLIGPDEREPAPQAGEWDPWNDERFTGGGFRG